MLRGLDGARPSRDFPGADTRPNRRTGRAGGSRGRLAREEQQKVSRISGLFQPLLLGVEGVILVTGGTLAGVGAVQKNGTLEGVGIGLAIQGLAFFLIDWAVLDRADDYLAVLHARGEDHARPPSVAKVAGARGPN